MDTNLSLALLGTALILLSLAGKIAAGGTLVVDLQNLYARAFIGVMGAALLAAAAWLWHLLGKQCEEIGPLPDLVIQTPGDGATVVRSVLVAGTVKGSSLCTRLWLVVNPIGEPGWWPQGGPLVALPDGRWEQPAFLGGRPGQRFRLSVVVASKDAHGAFVKYLEDATGKQEFPAKPMPLGTKVLSSREVTLDQAFR
jgi:hypothetical protein